MSPTPIIGIDLGTTNSLVAIWRDGTSQIIPNALGKNLTPSIVGLDDEGNVLVGMAARDRLLTHPHITTAMFKRHMGSARAVQLGKRSFRPEELSSIVLRSLKADAEAYLGQEVKEAIISVPAYFNDAQRKATRIAGQLAGLHVERLINEPTAAALAYGLNQAGNEISFMVFDLGGGTFDVSILELFDGVMEVHSTAGDNFLGGEDFVDALIRGFLDEAGSRVGLRQQDLRGKLLETLHDQAERAKRQLTDCGTSSMTVNWQGKDIVWHVSSERFEQLSKPLVDRIVEPVERALRDADIRAHDLHEVILVGGATRMPMVRKLVERMFGRAPGTHVNPDEVVALGAAVQAGLKARDVMLREVVLTDVCPYTLGIEVGRSFGDHHTETGLYLPIIERNTVIPASRVQRVTTLGDYQREVLIKIYQGESRLVSNNICLGQIRVKVPPKPTGRECIDVRFTYDINGLIEVEATVVKTAKTHRLVIEQNPGVLTPKEIESRLKGLAKLKIHPREQAENQAVLARAERLYEMTLGGVRDRIDEAIGQFEAQLTKQDPTRIVDARERLISVMNEIEGEPYL